MAKKIKIIPENIAFPEAIVLDNSEKWMTELYEEADRKTAEKFSRDSLAYKTITNGINTKNITGSQFFWNTNLENDSRFAYSDNSKQIPFGEKQKTIYTKGNGLLSRVCLGRYGDLYAGYDILADSDVGGRVVLKDAEGVVASENLRDYKNKTAPSLKEILEYSKKFVPKVVKEEFESGLIAKYKR